LFFKKLGKAAGGEKFIRGALATAEAELHAAKERLGVLERDMWAQARQATS